MQVYVRGVSLIAPGLESWPASQDILAGRVAYQPAPLPALMPAVLPATERRRSTTVIRLAVQIAHAALIHGQWEGGQIATVFASSGGDMEVLHAICASLAKTQRFVSPTHFHYSVHNAPAGYWHIAMTSQATATSLSSYDSSFASGLIEAGAQVAIDQKPVLLVAYDVPAPEPLFSARPFPGACGIGLLLTPERDANSNYSLSMELLAGQTAPVTAMENSELEILRAGNPAARGLPLLALCARGEAGLVMLDLLDDSQLRIQLQPC